MKVRKVEIKLAFPIFRDGDCADSNVEFTALHVVQRESDPLAGHKPIAEVQVGGHGLPEINGIAAWFLAGLKKVV